MALRARLGERLVKAGLVSPEQLQKALQVHAATGEQLGRTLVKLGYLDEDSLTRTLCADAGIPYITLSDQTAEPSAIALLPASVAGKHLAVPLRNDAGRLLVAMADPFDLDAVTAVERAVGRPIKVVAAPKDAVAFLISRSYNGSRTESRAAPAAPPPPPPPPPSSALKVGPSARTVPVPGLITTAEQPVQRQTRAAQTTTRTAEPLHDGASAATMADEIIARGVSMGATDVHLEPLEEAVRVRFRVDGLLHEAAMYPKAVQAPLMTRVKIQSGLDIAETRLPQDGRIRFQHEGRSIDVRVSTYPTVYGEDIVLRLLDRANISLDLEKLGIEPADLSVFRAVMRHPHGLVAVTGPTGSGKTTTLYAGLVELNTDERCIMTLEDPVEYELPRVRQSQIHPKAGLTFASGLRSMLRHDPDVILVGEIRDRDTVQIALSAALTGHLVLTTLHTTTAAGAIPRLLDMGAEPFVLASSLQMVVSQRLVRVLCQKCKVQVDLPDTLRERYGLVGANVYGPRGCPVCRNRGYRGRLGIFEFVPVTEKMAPAIYDRRPAEELHSLSGRPTMLDDGLKKVRAGVTSLDELLRVIIA